MSEEKESFVGCNSGEPFAFPGPGFEGVGVVGRLEDHAEVMLGGAVVAGEEGGFDLFFQARDIRVYEEDAGLAFGVAWGGEEVDAVQDFGFVIGNGKDAIS